MESSRKLRSSAAMLVAYAALALGSVGGVSTVLVLTADITKQHRHSAEGRNDLTEQSCLTENTVQNMSGQVFVYVKELCRQIAEAGHSPFAECVFANKALMASEDAVSLIRARCEAVSGGSSVEN